MSKEAVLNDAITPFLNKAITAGLRLTVAAFLLLIGFKLINFIGVKIENKANKRKLDKTLSKTFVYVFRLFAKLLTVVALIGFVGIDTSGLAALFVSIGAGIGLALNGALSNLAGGIIIIFTRPFRVDDFIEAQGHSGTVEEIHITMTKIRTPDNKVVYIPNGPLSSGAVVNYSVKDKRRVDFSFSIGYEVDFELAKRVVSRIFESHELILRDPEYMVRIAEHADSGITLVARAWVKSDDYWTVKFDVLEFVKSSFDREGIVIPYNQLDVRIKNN